jgi:hypothetical protein
MREHVAKFMEPLKLNHSASHLHRICSDGWPALIWPILNFQVVPFLGELMRALWLLSVADKRGRVHNLHVIGEATSGGIFPEISFDTRVVLSRPHKLHAAN